jgi:pyruvate-formate lyase-activating enzyme
MKCCFFCEPAGFPTLGVEYLVSVLRGNLHEVDVVFDRKNFTAWEAFHPISNLDDDIVDEILASESQILFAYCTTVNFQRLVHLFGKIKSKFPDIITCIGGPHPTYAHEAAVRKDSIDYACRGEGELAILEFIEYVDGIRDRLPSGIYRMNAGSIEGAGFGNLVHKLDDLPYPDKSDFFENVPNSRSLYSIASGRGCYNSCTFCNSPTMRNFYRGENLKFMRRRSVEDIIDELCLAKEAYRPKFVAFVDDTFIYNKKFLVVFAEQYKKRIGIPFGCSTIPDFFDEEIIDKLVDAGLSNVEVGIQSVNPTTRLNTFGRKETNEQFARFVHMLRKRGIYVNTDHIINPWDQRENLKEQVKVYSDVRPNFINVFHLQYFPNTQVIENAVKDGHLAPEAVDHVGEGSIESYFLGGSIPEIMKSLHDLIIFLSFVPFLPSGLTKWIVDSPFFKIFKHVPIQAVLPLRAISALFHSADASGRSQLKYVVLSLVKLDRLKANILQTADIKRIVSHKPATGIKKASPLGRTL